MNIATTDRGEAASHGSGEAPTEGTGDAASHARREALRRLLQARAGNMSPPDRTQDDHRKAPPEAPRRAGWSRPRTASARCTSCSAASLAARRTTSPSACGCDRH